MIKKTYYCNVVNQNIQHKDNFFQFHGFTQPQEPRKKEKKRASEDIFTSPDTQAHFLAGLSFCPLRSAVLNRSSVVRLGQETIHRAMILLWFPLANAMPGPWCSDVNAEHPRTRSPTIVSAVQAPPLVVHRDSWVSLPFM